MLHIYFDSTPHSREQRGTEGTKDSSEDPDPLTTTTSGLRLISGGGHPSQGGCARCVLSSQSVTSDNELMNLPPIILHTERGNSARTGWEATPMSRRLLSRCRHPACCTGWIVSSSSRRRRMRGTRNSVAGWMTPPTTQDPGILVLTPWDSSDTRGAFGGGPSRGA